MTSLLQSWNNVLEDHGGDWSCQGFWVMVVHRFGQWRYRIRNRWIRKIFSAIYKTAFKMVQIGTGIELPCEASVGKGTRIDHFGGIIVSGYSRIGNHCTLRQGVTIGLKNESDPCAPVLGDHVSIGAGAKILGNITIGDHVDIGANAVVLKDVPSYHIAVGIPARIQPKSEQWT